MYFSSEDEKTILKNTAAAYMQERGLLHEFQTQALIHWRKCWETSSLREPLTLSFEVDLIRLFDCSDDLTLKLVQYPAEARSIFQEALAEFLRKTLEPDPCSPLASVQLLLRCDSSWDLEDADSSFARNFGCLSRFRRYVLMSVTVSRSKTCNLATICVLSRCPNESCPGHEGRYVPMEELNANEPLGNCSNCNRKCIEDPTGRGQVRRVMAKFMPVGVFNNREGSRLHRSVICSITEPLAEKLELGDMYDIWGRYNVSIYEVWGLKQTSFFTQRPPIPLSLFPPSIRGLIASLGDPGPRNPWIFVRRLALELGSDIYRKTAAISLKIGLLLSLATLGSERCAPILCVGPNIDLTEEDIIDFAAGCADRNVCVTFPLEGSFVKNGETTWLHGGSLISGKTGVCNVGDWEDLNAAQKHDLLSVLDHGYIAMDNKKKGSDKPSGSASTECLCPALPLRTAVWAYHKFRKDGDQQQSVDWEHLLDVFGIPFFVDADRDLTRESFHERLELFLHGSEINSRTVPLDELIEFLRVINGISVSLSEEAAKLMKDYFVACRTLRGDVFPARSITFMTTLSEAHARLSLRHEVTYDDVIAVICLYETSMHSMYGQTFVTPPPLIRDGIQEIGTDMELFKSWLDKYFESTIVV